MICIIFLCIFGILVAPRCQVDYIQRSYNRLGEMVRLMCQIVSNPSVDLPFTWKFNGTTFLDGGQKVKSARGTTIHANLSSAIDHLVLVQQQQHQHGLQNAQLSNLRANADIIATNRANFVVPNSAVHTTVQRQHLLTNVITIVLKRWESFGHFSCASSNRIGAQTDECRWQIMPEGSRGGEGILAPGEHSRRRQHHLHQQHHFKEHHHPQQQQEMLNNCQVIESSSAVVVKCAHGNTQRAEEDIQTEEEDNLLETYLSPKLVYHVQVYRLTSDNFNQTTFNTHSEQYSHQIDHQPRADQLEPGKRVASTRDQSSVKPIIEQQPHTEQLVFDTINFTNPLFLITNLSSSTTYLLRIWSSKAHLDSTIEQVNITVRTRPIELDELRDQVSGSVHRTKLDSFAQFLQHPMALLFALVVLISLVFLTLTLAYALVKIRAVLDVRKGKLGQGSKSKTTFLFSQFEHN